MHLLVCKQMHVCNYVGSCLSILGWVYVCSHVHVYVCTYVYIYICVCVLVQEDTCMYACTLNVCCVFLCKPTYIYMDVHVYVTRMHDLV